MNCKMKHFCIRSMVLLVVQQLGRVVTWLELIVKKEEQFYQMLLLLLLLVKVQVSSLRKLILKLCLMRIRLNLDLQVLKKQIRSLMPITLHKTQLNQTIINMLVYHSATKKMTLKN